MLNIPKNVPYGFRRTTNKTPGRRVKHIAMCCTAFAALENSIKTEGKTYQVYTYVLYGFRRTPRKRQQRLVICMFCPALSPYKTDEGAGMMTAIKRNWFRRELDTPCFFYHIFWPLFRESKIFDQDAGDRLRGAQVQLQAPRGGPWRQPFRHPGSAGARGRRSVQAAAAGYSGYLGRVQGTAHASLQQVYLGTGTRTTLL